MDTFGAWAEGADAVAIVDEFAALMCWGALLSLLVIALSLVLCSHAIRRRRFWCAQREREVEVEYEEVGLPPYRVTVKSCSVFDPTTAVACNRRCVEGSYRRQWPSALPVFRRCSDRVSQT